MNRSGESVDGIRRNRRREMMVKSVEIKFSIELLQGMKGRQLHSLKG